LTFSGSDAGGHRVAAIYTLIETAKLNDVDPQAWLAYVPATLPDHPAKRIDELLPRNSEGKPHQCSRRPDSLTDTPAHREHLNGGTSLNLPSLGRCDKPASSPPAFDRCLGTRPTPSRARNSAVAVSHEKVRYRAEHPNVRMAIMGAKLKVNCLRRHSFYIPSVLP
jgi:hypothetical protein